MRKYHIYMLSLGSSPKAFSTNFQALYNSIKNSRKQLGINEMQAYVTLVSKARKGQEIRFITEIGHVYIIKKVTVVSKPVPFETITGNIF